jgi:hypothetical protein
MSRTTIAIAVAAALLTPVATAHAAVDTIGSDLSGTATTAIQHPEDTALVQLSGVAGPTVPTGGQVLSTHVKGCSEKGNVPQNPETALYIQDLRGSGASQKVISTSQQFHLPICGAGADTNTVTSFAPRDQCVEAGDLVGIVVGGQTPGYPQGTQYFIAKPNPGASLGVFSGNGHTVSGSHYAFSSQADTELLAQTRVGTGADSPSHCAGGSGGGGGGGGGGKPSASSLQLPRSVTVTSGRGQLQATCALAAGDTCKVSLVATIGKNRPKRVGTIAGSIGGGETAALTLKLNRTGKSTLSKGSFSATLRGKLRGKGGAVAVARKLSVTAG